MKDNMIKKLSIIVLFITSLLFTMQANAGFREALSALQHKDAELMLTEVEKAIETKNYDGVYLFVPTLSSWYASGQFVPKVVRDEAIAKLAQVKEKTWVDISVDNSWESFLTESQQLRLSRSLQQMRGLDFPYQEILRHFLLSLPESNQQQTMDEITKHANEQDEAEIAAENLGESILNTKDATHQQRLAAIEHAASLGSLRFQVLLAELQLGEQENIYDFKNLAKSGVVKLSKEKAYKQLEDIAKSSDVTWQDGDGICLVGDAYRDGLFGREKSNNEAYLWYLRGLLRGQGGGICDDRMQAAYKQGWVLLYDAENVKNIVPMNNRTYFYKFDETQTPKAIADYQAHQDLPILQIDVAFPNYRVKVYEDGRVEYATIRENTPAHWLYPQSNEKNRKVSVYLLTQSKVISGKYVWNIGRKQVKALMGDLGLMGIFSIPLKNNAGCICDGGEASVVTQILVRDNKKEKRINFYSWLLSRNAKEKYLTYGAEDAIKTIIEQYIPTQDLRCGDKVLGEQYFDCVAADKKIEESGNQWLAQQKSKK
jgi:hypothetical protein